MRESGSAPDVDARSVAQAVLAAVRSLSRELHPGAARTGELGLDDLLDRDYGLDSLARVELVARIERATGLRLPEGAFAEADTPRDLLRALRADVPGPERPPESSPPDRAALPEAAGRELPETVSTLIDALDWHAAEHPGRVRMLLYGEHEVAHALTCADLRGGALAVAGGLVAQRGIAPGDRVALMLPTGEDFFAAFLGGLYAGAVPVPLYPPARASQLEEHLRRVAGILADSGARLLIVSPGIRGVAGLLRRLAPEVEAVVTVQELERAPPATAPVPRCADDIAFLQYTSGSTGQPKGVVLTHANLLANLRAMRDATRTTSADLFVSWLPLYHDMGLIGACLGSMTIGFKLALMPPTAFLARPARWLRAIHRHRATMTAGPNFAYEFCVSRIRDDEVQGLDLSSLRLAFNGAEAVSPATLERFATRFAPHGLASGVLAPVYGLAEGALGLTFPEPGRGPLIDTIDRDALQTRGVARAAGRGAAAPIRLPSCGRPLAGHAVRIVASDGRELPERTQGEIEFRGPSATRGYFGKDREGSGLFDGEWLRTGDLGYLASGELFVTGRIKDIIIRGGHNVHPQELEAAAAGVRGVRRGGVAVFPALDPRAGTERLIVLAETLEADPAERGRIVAEISRLAVDLTGMPVDEVVLAPPHAVLKTSSGKIRRAACRERFERGEGFEAERGTRRQVARLALSAAAAAAVRAARRAVAVAWSARAIGAFALLAPLAVAGVLLAPGRTLPRRVARSCARALFGLCGAVPRVRDDPGAGWSADGAGRGCLVVANHASYLDGVLLTAVLPPERGPVFVAKRELASQRVAGAVLRRLGAVFVDRIDPRRGTEDAKAIEAALARGERVVVFPEGTFGREPGLLPFHSGAFVAAAALGVPIVPVAIRGTRAVLPDDDLVPRPARIEVDFGSPILGVGTEPWQAAVDLRAKVRGWLLERTGEPDLEP